MGWRGRWEAVNRLGMQKEVEGKMTSKDPDRDANGMQGGRRSRDQGADVKWDGGGNGKRRTGQGCGVGRYHNSNE